MQHNVVGSQVHWLSTRLHWSWWRRSVDKTAESLSECRRPVWWNRQGTSRCAYYYVTVVRWGRF